MKKYKIKSLISGLLAVVLLGTSFPVHPVYAVETEEPLTPVLKQVTISAGTLGSIEVKDPEDKVYQVAPGEKLILEVEEGSTIHLDAIPMQNAEIVSYTLRSERDTLQEITEIEELNQSDRYSVEVIVRENVEAHFTFREKQEEPPEISEAENMEPENEKQEEVPKQRGVSLPVSMAVNDTRKTFLEAIGLSGFESDYTAFIQKYASEDAAIGFYMGTPYTNTVGMEGSDLTGSGFQKVGWDIYSPRGDNMQGINLRLPKQYQGGMNCTGFVWHLFHKFGMEHGKNVDVQIPRLGGSNTGPAPFNGAWEGYVDILSNQVQIYSFNGKMTTLPSGKITNWEDGKQQMLQSGILDYGDIIYAYRNTTEPGTDGHVGIYVGDGRSDLFWHSMYAKTLNTVSGMPYPVGSEQNNGITEIVPKTDNVTWYVIKTGGASNVTVKLKKSSTSHSITNGNGCYSLKGAEYGVYRNPECTELAGTLITQDEEGNSGILEVAPGQYYVKEIKSPEGYLKNDRVYPVDASVGGKTYTVECEDVPGNHAAEIELVKKDAEGSVQGAASLAGAEFTVRYYDGYYTKKNLPDNATRTWVLETQSVTDSNGKTQYLAKFEEKYKVAGDAFYVLQDSKVPVLPLGTISIEETKAPKGYLLDGSYLTPEGSDEKIKGKYVTQIKKAGETVSLVGSNKFSVGDYVIRGGVSIEKWDLETDQKEPQGAASLEGAEFTITSRNENPVIVNGKTYHKGEAVLVITTNEKGTAATKEDVLPYGEYTISETKVPEGYLPEGENLSQDFEIREHGKIVKLSKTPAKNQVKRGDLQLVKAEAGSYNRMANVKFTITSKTTEESHTFITDENGFYSTSSSWNPHSQHTNRGETPEDGLWFGTSEVNDEKGALLYDTYIIEEQPCEANEGHELITFDVVIQRDHVVIDLGTITDELIPVAKIYTTAWDKQTNSKATYATDEVTVVDEVSYVNLVPEKKYTIKGILMDRESKEPFLVEGKEVTAEKEFEPKKTDGSITLEYTFDASGLEGKDLVVFENLYQGKQLIASHEDLEDADQTIHFRNPEIHTEASEVGTGTNYAYASEQVTIQDVVTYTDLIPGRTYTIKGTLMDLSTGKALLAEGKEVTAEKKFTAAAEDGSVDLKFIFDGSALRGKTVVVFERLFYEGKEIAAHTDLEDKKQTIQFQNPEIQTRATDKESGNHEGTVGKEVTIVDEVTYKDLIPGKRYTVKGILMEKETGKALKVDGKEIMAEKSFTAEKKSGSISISFTFDATGLENKPIVVFENLFYGEREIAVHADLQDENQTVIYKKIPEKTVTITGDKPKTTTLRANNPVKTGDSTKILPYIVLGGGALLMILILAVRFLGKRKQHESKRLPMKK